MTYSYEQVVWGQGTASVNWSAPTAFRLRQALKAISSLPAGSRVLEVGCGAGQFIRAIKQVRPELECVGADISEAALAKARQYNDGVRYEKSTDNFSDADNYYDAVLVFDVLEHVPSPAAMVNEIRRVLKPQGLFYFFVPCEGDYLSELYWLYKLKIIPALSEKHAGHINHWSRRQWLGLFNQKFWHVERARYSGHLFGQTSDVISFILMDRASRRDGSKQMNNEEYHTKLEESVKFKNLFIFFKKLINTLLYFESWLFCRLPSSNLHVVVRKLL